MINFEGTYLDGRSSRARPASFGCNGVVLRIKCGDSPSREVRLADCRIDPPLGSTIRTIRLPDSAVCESADMIALSEVEKMMPQNRMLRLVSLIESSWKAVMLSLAGIVVFVWLFHTYAIPFFAEKIARSVPQVVSDELSRRTLKIMDQRFLQPSALAPEKAARLRNAFSSLAKDVGPGGFRFRLDFRKSAFMGPNAFALPSGRIVMTDELVNISENDRELEGVLLHEIAHVKDRHALRRAIQDAGIFVVIAALTGDLSGISATAASLPTVLAESGYSRSFEREADRFAALYFVRRGWSIKPFQDILRRIAKGRTKFPGEAVLSTHPLMQERISDLQAIAGQHKKKGE